MFSNLKNIWRKSIRKSNVNIDPDEIFLDSHNLLDFDKHQFEGRLEKPISYSVYSIMIFFVVSVSGILSAFCISSLWFGFIFSSSFFMLRISSLVCVGSCVFGRFWNVCFF